MVSFGTFPHYSMVEKEDKRSGVSPSLEFALGSCSRELSLCSPKKCKSKWRRQSLSWGKKKKQTTPFNSKNIWSGQMNKSVHSVHYIRKRNSVMSSVRLEDHERQLKRTIIKYFPRRVYLKVQTTGNPQETRELMVMAANATDLTDVYWWCDCW